MRRGASQCAGAGRTPRGPIRSTPFGHVLSLGANKRLKPKAHIRYRFITIEKNRLPQIDTIAVQKYILAKQTISY